MTSPDAELPSSWATDESSPTRSKLWIVLAGVAVLAVAFAVVVVISKRTTKKPDGAWPASVSGRPSGLGKVNQPAAEVTATAKPGVYVWSDFDGWHLWVVHGSGVGAVTGTITGNDKLASAEPAVKGAGSVSVDGKVATFSLPTSPTLDGVDFNPGFYTDHLTIAVRDANGPISPSLVTKGSATAVKAMPLDIEQVPKSEAASR